MDNLEEQVTTVVEEFTCDLCRRYSPSGLTPTVIRQDFMVIFACLCRRCASDAKYEGGQYVQVS